jgi:hypothetical protein
MTCVSQVWGDGDEEGRGREGERGGEAWKGTDVEMVLVEAGERCAGKGTGEERGRGGRERKRREGRERETKWEE